MAAPRAPVNNSGKSCSCILIILYADFPSFNWNSKKNPKHHWSTFEKSIKVTSGQTLSQHDFPANYISLQPSQPALHIWFSEEFFRHPAAVVNTWTERHWWRSREAPEKCLGPKVFPLSMSKYYVQQRLWRIVLKNLITCIWLLMMVLVTSNY